MPNHSIPSGPRDITAHWLTDVLGVAVDAVRVEPIGTGQTGATYRVTPTAPPESGLPPTLVAKLPARDPAIRERCALGYRSECAFYDEVAASVAVPLPAVYHCDITESATDFVLLLEDLAPAAQGDQLAGCPPEQAEPAVTALAGLHGPRWCDPAWLTFTGTAMPKPDANLAAGLAAITRTALDITLDKLGDRLADRATLALVAELTEPWLLYAPDRFAVLHGDFRVDNLLFHPGGTRVTVVDWQTVSVGLPARDLAYFLGTSLLPPVRAARERELVAHYHRELTGYGVTGYTAETCWQDYRVGMLQIPVLTALGFAFAAATDRGDDMIATMLDRGCRAIRELGTLDLIAAA
ncbi:phosphotransferase family protein [Nocardia harenae]|uniref:phosphotransferase family protein n=1 Tax=Nocardia harenae TaxID=358707 RepID=UPI00082AC39A|nr:aminoglycoside phosphotransferase family protein [Nocardia harenae]